MEEFLSLVILSLLLTINRFSSFPLFNQWLNQGNFKGILIVLTVSLFILLIFFQLQLGRRRRNREALLIKSGIIIFLPWATITQAYRLAWVYRNQYYKVCWLWGLALPMIFLLNWMQHLQNPLPCIHVLELHLQNKDTQDATGSLIYFLQNFGLLIVAASIAVRWHRLILRDEPISDNRHLRVDKEVRIYFLSAALIYIISNLQLITYIFLPLNSNTPEMGFSFILEFITMVAVNIITIISVCLPVILPAKAVGIDQITLRDVWRKTRHNFWRLFFGSSCCFIPALIPALISAIILGLLSLFFRASECINPVFTALAYSIITLVFTIFSLPVYLSFLSLSYRFFFERNAPRLQKNS